MVKAGKELLLKAESGDGQGKALLLKAESGNGQGRAQTFAGRVR